MIKFIKHTAYKDYNVKMTRFKIPKGKPILKILFDNKDIHTSRTGKLHLDIWGMKLNQLKKLIGEK